MDKIKSLEQEAVKLKDILNQTVENMGEEKKSALRQMQEVVDDRNSQIQALLGSRSWRLTSPLRVSTTLARNIKRKVSFSKLTNTPKELLEPLQGDIDQHDKYDAVSVSREPFDQEFYVDNYPDVAASGIDPYKHYMEFGKAEERLGIPPPLKLAENVQIICEVKDYVLVVCHEASRTGAPILGWNICRELSQRYNVIALLLGEGDIAEYFLRDCAVVAGPYDRAIRQQKAVRRTIASLNERYNPRFAIVNSIESRSVLRALSEQYVPSVLLVHEFSKFHCYPEEIVDTLGWASEVVFPAKVVQANAILERTLPSIKRSHIVPQGRSTIPAPEANHDPGARQQADQERNALVERVFGVKGVSVKPFLVLGAGTIEYRKGVDLFIAAAAELKRIAPDRQILMVWVGRTYDSHVYKQYRTFIESQIESSGLEEQLLILDETPHLDVLYKLADLFFVSSRLDPLPNVAIDAMTLGTPLICFDHATGVAEILSSDPTTNSGVLPYLNAQAAAEAILDLSASPSTQRAISEACKKIAAQIFDMPSYVLKLEMLAKSAASGITQRKSDEEFLNSNNRFLADFCASRRSFTQPSEVLRTYLKQSQNRIYIRKPAPGFNPAAYADHAKLTSSDPDPFVHWLQAGEPKGPWQEEVINLASAPVGPLPKLRVGVHIHAYYPDMLKSILDRLAQNEFQCDYLISVPNAKSAEDVKAILATKTYDGRLIVRLTANYGRDIGPFFTEFADELRDYDVIGHFHTKKSPHVTLSNLVPDWIEFMLENLIGGKYSSADAIITAFSADAELGLVFADDPHLIGWDKNLSFAERLCERMGMPPPVSGFFPFPIGTMFWARPKALAPLFDLSLSRDDYPSEPLPIDGSMLHALERLLPAVTEFAGFKHRSTYAKYVNR